MNNEMKEIPLDSLQPFSKYIGRTCEGKRLQEFMCSIEQHGLQTPIIVRPNGNDKYEIIAGHNRAKVMKELGRSTIMAKIEYEISDDDALAIFYDTNLNQQSFSDWNYAQRIEAVKYSEKMMKEYSQQGKRTDLKRKEEAVEETSVQTRQKSEKNGKRATTRDKMANRMGISTATFSKYRRIIKLPDELLDPLVQLLDERKVSFDAVYIIANKRESEIKMFLEYTDKYPGSKIDLDKLKKLPHKNDQFTPESEERVKEVFTLEDDDTIPIIRKK